MFKNPRRGRQGKNFTTNVPKILDLKSSNSEQIFFRKLSLGAADEQAFPWNKLHNKYSSILCAAKLFERENNFIDLCIKKFIDQVIFT